MLGTRENTSLVTLTAPEAECRDERPGLPHVHQLSHRLLAQPFQVLRIIK